MTAPALGYASEDRLPDDEKDLGSLAASCTPLRSSTMKTPEVCGVQPRRALATHADRLGLPSNGLTDLVRAKIRGQMNEPLQEDVGNGSRVAIHRDGGHAHRPRSGQFPHVVSHKRDLRGVE